jgi:hypothetical protein
MGDVAEFDRVAGREDAAERNGLAPVRDVLVSKFRNGAAASKA